MIILLNQTQPLGFIFGKESIITDPHKVEMMRHMATSTTVRRLVCFIVMCSYYKRFIPDFSEIAIPLFKLTRNLKKLNGLKNVEIL